MYTNAILFASKSSSDFKSSPLVAATLATAVSETVSPVTVYIFTVGAAFFV